MIRFLPLLWKKWVCEIVQVMRHFEIVDLLNWIGLPIRFFPKLVVLRLRRLLHPRDIFAGHPSEPG